MKPLKFLSKTLYVLGFLLVLVFFQNCGALMAPDPALDQKINSIQNSSSVTSSPAPVAGNSLEAQAINILQNKCFSCHGSATNGGVTKINDPTYLISVGQIIPGNAMGSLIYDSINTGRMPLGSNLVSATELLTIRDWINAGAKTPTAGTTPIVTIPLAGNFNSVYNNVILPKCVGCHSASLAKSGVRLDSYAMVLKHVTVANAGQSKLYTISLKGEMPPSPNPNVTSAELKAVSDWINSGALNN